MSGWVVRFWDRTEKLVEADGPRTAFLAAGYTEDDLYRFFCERTDGSAIMINEYGDFCAEAVPDEPALDVLPPSALS